MKSLMFLITFVLLYFFTVICSFAQTGVALPFLIESPDARYAGMGNTGTAIANDIYATYRNPGGLGLLNNTTIPKSRFPKISENKIDPYLEASFSIAEVPLYSITDRSLCNILAGSYFESLKGVVVLDYCYEISGSLVRTAENGQVLGKYTPKEYYIGLAYGTSIGDDWGIGAKIKYLHSDLGKNSNNHELTINGFAFDIGALWNPDLGTDPNSMFGYRCFRAGINLQNIGPSVSYFKGDDPLPTTLRFGIGLKLNINTKNKITLAIDGTKLLVHNDGSNFDQLPKSLISSWDRPFDVTLGLGAEYWYKHIIALRTGYYTEPENIGNRDYFTIGVSIKYIILQFDFSCNSYSGEIPFLTNAFKYTLRIGG